MGKRSVVWNIVPGLIALSAMTVSASAGEPIRATVDANSLSVAADSVKIAEYRFGDVPFKPYVKELFTPNGLNVLLDAPHDHLHHHALMFAVAVDGVNFWEETPTAGRQEHVRFADIVEAGDGGEPRVGFMERLNWTDPSGATLLAEQRSIVVPPSRPDGRTTLIWESRLAVPTRKKSVTLTGSHYFGLGMRFIRDMDGRGKFRNADNKPGTVFRGEERLVRSNWCAYIAHVDGDEVTIAMFGHPDNPRGPTTWFTMAQPFAYLSATLGLHEKSLEIVEGKPLKLRYAVVLWDRPVESEEIERLYQQWQR
ncbi:MAG: PmoA family protein [Phycisphaerales bacterium]|nr:MAG: PmoA family protein [Phycisphaerales bacterium]